MEEEKRRKAYKVQDVLTLALESGSPIRHHTLTLGSSHTTTEIGLSRLAEFAFSAFCAMICQR